MSQWKRDIKVQFQSCDWSSYLWWHHVTFPIWVSTIICWRIQKKKSQMPTGICADNSQLNTTPYLGHCHVFLYVIIDTPGNFNVYLYFTQQDLSSCCFLCQFRSGTCCYLLPSNIYSGVALYVSCFGIIIKVDLGCWLAVGHPYSFHLYSRHVPITEHPLHFAQLCR